MLSYSKKELDPVFYGTVPVKILKFRENEPDRLLFTMHWHERMELLRVCTGELTVVLGEDKITACAGELVVIPPSRLHMGYTEQSGVSYHAIMFEPDVFKNNAPGMADFFADTGERGIDFINKTDDNGIVCAADKLLYESEQTDKAAPLMISAAVYELLGLLYRRCTVESKSAHIKDKRISEIIEYINKNFSKAVSCEELSRRFGYDNAYFSRKFKSVTGITPNVYIKILKLEKAKKLLEKGADISRAASESGFSDNGYFSRCFKKFYNITPSEYILNCR